MREAGRSERREGEGKIMGEGRGKEAEREGKGVEEEREGE